MNCTNHSTNVIPFARPRSVTNKGDIAPRGKYDALLDLWNGENAASSELNKAEALTCQIFDTPPAAS